MKRLTSAGRCGIIHVYVHVEMCADYFQSILRSVFIKEVRAIMKRTTYVRERTNEISFPLGGIGTGSVGLAGNGRLIDWEIFNRPSKGSVNGYTHFAVKASRDGVTRDARVICGDVYKNLAGQTGMNFGFGLSNTTMEGFPHFRDFAFNGEFPIAKLTFDDKDAPCSVTMTAFNPFIPQNDRDSSIPAAFFELTVRNNTYEELDFSIAATLKNPFGGSQNKYFEVFFF